MLCLYHGIFLIFHKICSMLCILNLSLKEITLQNKLHNCMTIKVLRTENKCSCHSWESNLGPLAPQSNAFSQNYQDK